MGTVPTGQMERELRKAYLQWLAGVGRHQDDLQSYVSQFEATSRSIITRFGGHAASLGALADFPVPKLLELSPVANVVYDQMKQSAIQAGIQAGLQATDVARQMLHAGLDKSFNRLNRLARTETVSAYWQNQWKSTEDLPMIVMVWGSEESKRTCDYCRSRDGLVVEDSSIRDHPQGRCTLIPTLRSQVKYKGTLEPDGSVTMDPRWDPAHPDTKTKPPVFDTPPNKSIPNVIAPAHKPAELRIRPTPKVAKLPQLPAVPKDLTESVARGAANPKNRRWGSVNNYHPRMAPGVQLDDYSINCTRVAATTEMRRRGFDVAAAPAAKDVDKSDDWITKNWYDPVTNRSRKMKPVANANVLMRQLEAAPEGARFFVVGPWKTGSAHIWNAEKVNGKVVFIEGQGFNSAGQEVTQKYLDTLEFEKWKKFRGGIYTVRWMRVDDQLPTDLVTRAFDK